MDMVQPSFVRCQGAFFSHPLTPPFRGTSTRPLPAAALLNHTHGRHINHVRTKVSKSCAYDDVRQFDDLQCCLSRDERVDSLNTIVTPTTSDLVVKETLELDEHTYTRFPLGERVLKL
jgi:hypothetical protein